MLLRDCAGGVVFFGNKVFLMKNEKNEWIMPKGLMKADEKPEDAARRRLKEEAGLDAQLLGQAGRTLYEFFSVTRQLPVCNRIVWYIAEVKNDSYRLDFIEKFADAGFFDLQEALEKITYSQEKSLVLQSYKKLAEFRGEGSREN